MNSPEKILLIEDSPSDVALIRAHLAASPLSLELTACASLKEGLARAAEEDFAGIFLDLSLPDSLGLETVRRAVAALPEVPVVVLTGLQDEQLGLESLRAGAQDYLVKGSISTDSACRAVRYAIERHRILRDLHDARDRLEEKVRQRTEELAKTVADLQAQVQRRLVLERLMRMVSECNQALVRIDDETALMQAICGIILEVGGYRLAWVGYAQQDERRSVLPVACVGFEEGYLENARISWADVELGRGPTGAAIRLNQPRIGQDFLTDPELAPWREQAVKRGFGSSVALPLAAGGGAEPARPAGPAFGALTIYAAGPRAFDEAQVKVLMELADDLAFGIMALRTRRALRASRQQLQRVLHNAPVMIWAVDMNGVCTLADGNLEPLGLASQQIVGRHMSELAGADSPLLAHVRLAKAGEAVVAEVELGSLRFESRYVPLHDDAGQIAGVMCVATDITQRRRAEREVLEAAEREQRRIGRDLHDSIQGNLVGMKLLAQSLRQRVNARADGFDAPFQNLLNVLADTLTHTRGLSRSLCPMDLAGEGVVRSLQQLAQTTAGLFKVPCEFTGQQDIRIQDESVASQLYYIAHEALNNALKHARPKKIELSLRSCEGWLVLSVRDDGVGMPAGTGSSAGMGMRTMAYRASVIGAVLDVQSSPGQGTTVQCRLRGP